MFPSLANLEQALIDMKPHHQFKPPHFTSIVRHRPKETPLEPTSPTQRSGAPPTARQTIVVSQEELATQFQDKTALLVSHGEFGLVKRMTIDGEDYIIKRSNFRSPSKFRMDVMLNEPKMHELLFARIATLRTDISTTASRFFTTPIDCSISLPWSWTNDLWTREDKADDPRGDRPINRGRRISYNPPVPAALPPGMPIFLNVRTQGLTPGPHFLYTAQSYACDQSYGITINDIWTYLGRSTTPPESDDTEERNTRTSVLRFHEAMRRLQQLEGQGAPEGEEEDLQSVLNNYIMPQICVQLGTALGILHSCGLTHGDLGGDNVILCLNNEGGLQLLLIDFGMARDMQLVVSGSLSLDNSILESQWPVKAWTGILKQTNDGGIPHHILKSEWTVRKWTDFLEAITTKEDAASWYKSAEQGYNEGIASMNE